MRPIIDDSKMTSEGWSVNSGMSYEWMHMVQFTTIHHCLKGIVMLEKRLLQLGFKSRYFRIWVAKHDVEGAYRIRFISKEDRWLSVFHQEGNGFVIDNRQHFGSKASVTNYHRLAYNIEHFKANVNFIRKFYPQLGLPLRDKYSNMVEPPELDTIAEDLKFQRRNPHSQCDPFTTSCDICTKATRNGK